jgi:hypothetical protein
MNPPPGSSRVLEIGRQSTIAIAGYELRAIPCKGMRHLRPTIRARFVLVDNPRLVNQIAALERRTSRGGKDSIDHSPGAHDDVVANVVAGLAHCVVNRHTVSSMEMLF